MPTRVELNLEASGDGTIVRVKEDGYPNSEAGLAACLDCAAGWGEAMTLLKFYLEHGLTYNSSHE